MVKQSRHSDMHNTGSSTDEDKMLKSPNACTGICQHIKKSVDASKLRKEIKTAGLVSQCILCDKTCIGQDGFEYDDTLWICLKCGTQLCGRSRNQHALHHFKTAHSDSHALTMNTRSFEIWCYECDNEVSANSRKNLLECVEFVKKFAQKPPDAIPLPLLSASANSTAPNVQNIETKIISTWEAIQPHVPSVESTVGPFKDSAVPLLPPEPSAFPGIDAHINEPSITSALPSIFDMDVQSSSTIDEVLPRVRGLTNLGNTCFFNSVLQCLAQTPYLLEVLKESSQPGEEFILPGGTFKLTEEKGLFLPMIKGTLSSWESLTAALGNVLEELQSGGGVFTPTKLFDKLCNKCPQFRGGDQHDSHELLRHLLESVRSEDLKRYQRVILNSLGYKDQESVSEEMKLKCKIYGNQAADRILRPDQVFRGFLVSTLTCQECFSVSSRHEYFLDLSLPVSVEKPQPPNRRKASPDSSATPVKSFITNPTTTATAKSQHKKDKTRDKAKRATKHHNNKIVQKYKHDRANGRSTEMSEGISNVSLNRQVGSAEASAVSSVGSSSQQSDADIEDNLMDDNTGKRNPRANVSTDTNGNNQLLSPMGPEKRGDSPEIMNKDSMDEDENDSGIATSPANAGNIISTNKNSVHSAIDLGLSDDTSNIAQFSVGNNTEVYNNNTRTLNSSILNPTGNTEPLLILNKLNQMQLQDQKLLAQQKRTRTQSHSDWNTTIGPRYQCVDGECSIQSCLNNFTAVELMTGNNKVGCDNCTKCINGDDPKANTVNTNATKQFLISSPPAVLILHLKRFQLGVRCMFRKLTRTVNFPMVLDLAPFCGSKIKNLPNIDRKQKKLLYALYGIVEHAGSMYGGHYTAYVKVRPKLSPEDPRWKFMPQGSKAELDQDDEQLKKLDELLAREKARELRMKTSADSDEYSNSYSYSFSSTSSSDLDGEKSPPKLTNPDTASQEAANVQIPAGKWYYVSDSRVQEVKEEEVLNAQAYLLFYERIY